MLTVWLHQVRKQDQLYLTLIPAAALGLLGAALTLAFSQALGSPVPAGFCLVVAVSLAWGARPGLLTALLAAIPLFFWPDGWALALATLGLAAFAGWRSRHLQQSLPGTVWLTLLVTTLLYWFYTTGGGLSPISARLRTGNELFLLIAGLGIGLLGATFLKPLPNMANRHGFIYTARVAGSAATLVAIGLLVSTTVFTAYLVETAKVAARELLMVNAREMHEMFNQLVLNLENAVQREVGYLEPINATTAEQAELLHGLQSIYQQFQPASHAVMVGQADGLGLVMVDEPAGEPITVRRSFADRSYYQELQSGAAYAVSPMLQSRIDQATLVGIAVALPGPNGELGAKMAGWVVIGLKPEKFSSLLPKSMTKAGTLHWAISDQENKIIATNQSNLLQGTLLPDSLRNLPLETVLYKSVKGNFSTEPQDVNSDLMVWSQQLEGNDWRIFVEIPVANGLRRLPALKADALLVGSLILVLTLLVAFVIGQLVDWQIGESHGRYQRLVENAPDWIYRYELGPRHGFSFVNEAALTITGYAPAEYYADPDLGLKIIHPVDREQVQTNYLSLPHQSQMMRLIRKDGVIVWVETQVIIITDKAGRPVALEGITRDITARKQAEEALLESQTRLKLLNSIATGMTAGMSVEQTIERVVQQISDHFNMLRVAYSTIDAQGCLTVIQAIEPPEMPSLTGVVADLTIVPEYLHTLRSGKPVIVADVAHDSRLAPLADALLANQTQALLDVPLRHSDQLVGLLCFDAPQPRTWSSHEINILTEVAQYLSLTFKNAQVEQERQRAQQALAEERHLLRTLIDNLPNTHVFVKDTKSRFITTSAGHLPVLGVETLEEVIGQTDFAFFPQELAEHYYVVEQAVIHSGQPIIDLEEPETNRAGEKRWFLTTKVPLHDSSGQIAGLVGMSRDITQHKQLEEQLRHAQKMEAVGRLAGGMAHDFNNLLVVIQGYTELLLSRLSAADPLREELEQIKKAGERAASLTRQLLAFSRKQILQPRILNLNIVVADMDRMLHRLIGEDINLVTILSPNLDHIKADRGQIEQVILNLAINARDAMPQGGQLTIETANVYLDTDYAGQHVNVEPGDYVTLAISDTGVGMDVETQAHIFEPFFTTKEQGKGTGLGLATVHGIINQSGGHIWVYSEPDHGTTFKIYLPRLPAVIEPVGREHLPETLRQGMETILLAEDEEMVRALAQRILVGDKYTVLEARHGQEAIQIGEQHPGPIHLLITDVVMPYMGGHELAKQLMRLRPGIKVLYVSGYTDNVIVHQGILAAGTAFLQKPFTPNILLRKVREVLDTPPEQLV